MENITKSVTKKDHSAKIRGEALYVADYPTDGMLVGKFLRSTKARAKIVEIKIPKLPEGYVIADKNDVSGENRVKIVLDDTPVFADEIVEFIGDPILLLMGEDEKIVNNLLEKIEVIYEDLEAVIDMEKSETAFFDFNYSKGDTEKAFENADKIIVETFRTGHQEQAYLETNGLIAIPEENGKISIHGSLQCPFYVHGAVKNALGVSSEMVAIRQDTTGGAFGGKEDYPSILACQIAVGAKKAGKPVRIIYDRKEDMEFTSKRHPSITKYKIAVKNDKITAMDIDVLYNAGAYTTLSAVVLQRGIICSSGVYKIPNLTVKGKAVKTNTVPCGAFRGFGAPQTFFSIEMAMNHVAKELNIDKMKFKIDHLVQQGDSTSTGGKYHFNVPLKAMIEEIDKECDLFRKHIEYGEKQKNRYRKGVGLSLFFHGAGFTGSGERDHIKAVAQLKKHKNDKVEILVSITDMGQGVNTTFCKIVAKELGISMENIVYKNADTDFVPDSGPTVASRSLMIVGELLRRAAVKLKEKWEVGVEQIVEEHYKEPDFLIPFDIEKFSGDAYPTYSWGVNVVELEVDTLTGMTKILGVWGNFDVGTPIDENIVLGQTEGGIVQAITYASMEQISADKNGRIRNKSFTDYIIPTSADIPNLKIILHVEKYPDGPYGAKGAGELPAVGGAAAYIDALEQALNGININKIPFSAENVLEEIMKEEVGI